MPAERTHAGSDHRPAIAHEQQRLRSREVPPHKRKIRSDWGLREETTILRNQSTFQEAQEPRSEAARELVSQTRVDPRPAPSPPAEGLGDVGVEQVRVHKEAVLPDLVRGRKVGMELQQIREEVRAAPRLDAEQEDRSPPVTGANWFGRHARHHRSVASDRGEHRGDGVSAEHRCLAARNRPELLLQGWHHRTVTSDRAVVRSSSKRANPPIVVSGLPRSGTSWVAKALSFDPDYTYFREPDNPAHVDGALDRFRNIYLPVGALDPEFEAHLNSALRGEIATPFTMVENRGPLLGHLPRRVADRLGSRLPALYRRKPGVLLKLVYCSLALESLTSIAPNARVVVVLRHPCGTFASYRRLGWDPRPDLFLADECLVADHLEPYVEVIESAQSFWERAGAHWAVMAKVVSTQAADHPDWAVVQHEWLCEEPLARFRTLHRAMGLTWTDRADRFLRDTDRAGDASTYSLYRSSAAEPDKWTTELDQPDIAACRRVVEAFNLPWYPDFSPRATDPWLPGYPT